MHRELYSDVELSARAISLKLYYFNNHRTNLDCVKFRFAIVQKNVFFSERLFEFRAHNPSTNTNYFSSLINALLDAIL